MQHLLYLTVLLQMLSKLNMFISLFRNPYDIARKDLLSQISKLRATLLRPNGVAGSLLKEGRWTLTMVSEIDHFIQTCRTYDF